MGWGGHVGVVFVTFFIIRRKEMEAGMLVYNPFFILPSAPGNGI